MQSGKHQGWALVLGFAALTLLAAGCGDKDKKDTAPVDAGPVDAGPPTTDQCIQMAADMNSQSPQTTIDCLCDKCLTEMTMCNGDEGCVDIRSCADRTGCLGLLCYLGTPAPECAAVIDSWGGPTGLSTVLATQLNDCNDAQCNGKSVKDAGALVKKDAGSDEDAGN